MSNHLGNVLVTISDKKIAVPSTTNPNLIAYYTADVVTANDYYPFGMAMLGRKYTQPNSNYRYGFNGKENDNEVKGEGNQQDYGMRIYDTRLGKFLSVDPLIDKYPELSSYQYANNSPIANIDLDGQEDYYYKQVWDDNGQNPKITLLKTESSLIFKSVFINGVYFGDKLTQKGAQEMAAHYGNFNKEAFDHVVAHMKQDMEEYRAKVKQGSEDMANAMAFGMAAQTKKGTYTGSTTQKQQQSANNKTTTAGQKTTTNNTGTQNNGGNNNQTNPQKAGALAGTGSAGNQGQSVVYYRGGNGFTLKDKDIKYDPQTGQVKTTHGLSIHAEADKVANFGGAYKIVSIPKELQIIQRGKDKNHFEIVPKQQMSKEDFQKHLNQIITEKVNTTSNATNGG